ncbi:MAG: DUF1080 domain-containing protein [Nitrospira sp.]|nr:DUF1080 domain-containing protein [Nitrospira sp.]
MIRLVLLGSIVALLPNSSWTGDPKPPPTRWKELFNGKNLDGWKPSFTDNAGKIEVRDGAIILGRGMKMTGLTYAGKDFPKTNYEVILEGKRLDGRDFFATTTFPVGDGFCSLVVGGWGGTTVGISSINGSDASENETTSSMEFQDNRWYQIRIRVTDAMVECWIDQEQVVKVPRKGRRFTTRIECDDCQPFGLATYDTVGAIRNIRVRMLSDEEKKAGVPKE